MYPCVMLKLPAAVPSVGAVVEVTPDSIHGLITGSMLTTPAV
jgi:hypothetical protein